MQSTYCVENDDNIKSVVTFRHLFTKAHKVSLDERGRAQEKPRLCGSVGNEVENALIKESDRAHGQARK